MVIRPLEDSIPVFAVSVDAFTKEFLDCLSKDNHSQDHIAAGGGHKVSATKKFKGNINNRDLNIRPDGQNINGEPVISDPKHFDNKISTEHMTILSHDQSNSTQGPVTEDFEFDRKNLFMTIQVNDQSIAGGESAPERFDNKRSTAPSISMHRFHERNCELEASTSTHTTSCGNAERETKTRKRCRFANRSPLRKRLRRGCRCHESGRTKNKFNFTKGNRLAADHSYQTNFVQPDNHGMEPCCDISDRPRAIPHACPRCHEPLVKKTVPLRHQGNKTVPLFVCAQRHMFMHCFTNERHTELYECTRTRQGKLIHNCEHCPPKKRKSVLCDYCFARFKPINGRKCFHPKEGCPYYLAKHPHVIKYSHRHQLESLLSTGVIQKLVHPENKNLRQRFMVALGIYN